MGRSIDWWRDRLGDRLDDLAGIEPALLFEAAQDVGAEHGVTAPVSDAWLAALRAPAPAPPAPGAAPAIRAHHKVICRCGERGKVTTAFADPAPVGWQCAKCAAAAAGTSNPSDWRAPQVKADAAKIADWPARSKFATLLWIKAPATRRCAAALMHDIADSDLVDPAILATWLEFDSHVARGDPGDATIYAEALCRSADDARRRCPARDGTGWDCQRRTAGCVLAAAGA